MKHLPLINNLTAQEQAEFLKSQNADEALAFVEGQIEKLNDIDTSSYTEAQLGSFNAWMTHWNEVKTLLQ